MRLVPVLRVYEYLLLFPVFGAGLHPSATQHVQRLPFQAFIPPFYSIHIQYALMTCQQ